MLSTWFWMEPEKNVVGRPILRVDRRLCPHCSQSVSFKAHKRLYYDASSAQWITSDTLRRQSIINSDGTLSANEDNPPTSLILEIQVLLMLTNFFTFARLLI